MNSLLRSFLLAMADAALNWLRSLEDDHVLAEWLRAKLDEIERAE